MMFNSIASGTRTACRRAIDRFAQEEKGAVLVELSLVAPFLLLLSAGVFEFSNILHTRLLIEAGVEDAARYLARCPRSSWTDCIISAKNLAVSGTIDGTGDARVANWTSDAVAVSPSVACTDTGTLCFATTDDSGTELYRSNSNMVMVVQVSTSFDYVGTGLWSYLGFGALTITASHEERVLGS